MCIDIKNQLKEKTIKICDFNQADSLLFETENLNLNRTYIVFESSSLKQYFLDHTTNTIINTNSSYDRFCEDMINYNKNIIFNNINYCNDIDILNIIIKTNNILLD